MGGSFSTFCDWLYWSLIPGRRHHLQAVDVSPDNTLLLLSAAAQLARLSSRMDDTSEIDPLPLPSERSSSEMKLAAPSDTSDDSDEFCTLPESERQRIFHHEQSDRRCDRFIIGNEESYGHILNQTIAACGSNRNCYSIRRMTELGLGPSNADAYGSAIRVAMNNKYFPNSRKIVDKSDTKAFCVQHLNLTDELVVATQDERIRFYKPSGKNDRYIRTKGFELNNIGWSVLDVAFSPQSRGFAYCTWKDAVMFCRYLDADGLSYETCNLNIPPSESSSIAVFSVRFSQDGREILAGTSDYSIYIFDVNTLSRVVSVPRAHDDDVNAVCYADEAGNLIFSGSDDGLLKVWDRRCLREGDPHPIGIFAGHKDGITYIDSRGDSRYLLSNSKDQTIKLWDVRHFSSRSAAEETKKAVSRQSWDYRWQAAPQVLEKPLPGDSSVLTLKGHRVLHTLVRAKFSPHSTGQRYIYTGCAGGEVVVYDIITRRVEKRLGGHRAVVRDVSWSDHRNEIVSCSWDGSTAVWRWDERKDGVIEDEDSSDDNYMPYRMSQPKLCSKPRRRLC